MAVRDAARRLRDGGLHTSSKSGTVVEVRRDYEDKNLVHVEIELPAVKTRKRGKKRDQDLGPVEPYRPRASATVPMSMGLKVGQKVTVTTSVQGG